ncbi:MAG: alpha/beta hydrolase [Bacteroidales bacterium]
MYNNRPVSKRENQRVILFFHGGGFVWGDIEIYDNLCSKIARKTGSVLVSVEYRLAPEYPYPYAIKDSWGILLWASDNIIKYGGNPRKVTVMGDSAGGNISAVLSVISREKGAPEIESQVLIYPLTMFIDTLTPSRKYFIYENERDFVLSDDFLLRADHAYLRNNENRRDPTISPHFAPVDSLYPRALIITAQCDPLRDEGKEYAGILHDAGVRVEYFEGKGMMHGFVSFYQALKEGRKAINEVADFIEE